MRGELREKILDECPDDFRDELADWINDLEQRMEEIVDLLDISSVHDLSDIEDAKSKLEDLKDAIW